MSKLIIGIIVAVLVLGGAFFLFTNNSNNTSDSAEIAMEIESIESEDAVEANSGEMDIVTPVDKLMVEPTEDAEMFEIAEGSEVSYTAQKRFLSKADAVVVGVTQEVTGSGWVDLEVSKGYIAAGFNLTDLVSDSPKRDADIIPMFVDTEVKYVANITNLNNLEKNTAFSVVVPSEVTINGVTNTVDFDVTGTVGDNGIDATGTATIMLSDFEINPPSLANVYTVDDEILLTFDIKGKSLDGMMTDDIDGIEMEKEEVMDGEGDSDNSLE